MAIQIVNLAVPNGDTPRSANTKINANFTDPYNAASKLVGTGYGQVPLAENLNKALHGLKSGFTDIQSQVLDANDYELGSKNYHYESVANTPVFKPDFLTIETRVRSPYGSKYQIAYAGDNNGVEVGFMYRFHTTTWQPWRKILSTGNTTQDSNGFIKGASPIVDLYSDSIELNSDAEKQGITFEKLGVGDYLVKGSLGFAQEGWYIETPKDANGNVLVAVVYKQLANNDLSIKTYAKKFDDETGDIVANLAKPRDIPAGRFISLRLHELPKEPPVMPTETQAEV